ncbi:MAG: hypothetical protein Q9224_001041 [Gallowayella concinna]
MAMSNNTGNCANVAAPNYTFPGLTSPACGVKSKSTSANVSFLLTTGCCDTGSALYNDPAVPCIHFCSSSRSNDSFARCVRGFLTEPRFDVEQFWCLNNPLVEFSSATGRTAGPPLTEARPRWKKSGKAKDTMVHGLGVPAKVTARRREKTPG